MIVPRNYENLHILHENTMPNRCYYIPDSNSMNPFIDDREQSDRFQLLNGQWKFRYYKSIYELQDEFYAEDYDVNNFNDITVPGVWQNAGYDAHQYTNIRYPFPFDPPYVPQNNPCGAYVYDFEYHRCEKAPNAYLNFEGVDSCFYVWINGTYVGYSQVSHSTSEFDITDVLREGKNRISVLVLKWCDGSYLEDQDKFRMSGIFRDVYILKRPKSCIYDYFIKTNHSESCADVIVDITYLNRSVLTDITIYDADGNSVCESRISGDAEQTKKKGMKNKSVRMSVNNPILWNPEHPYLYTIVFKTEDEVITDRFE